MEALDQVLQTVFYRLIVAITTIPDAKSLLYASILLAVLAVISLPLGLYLRFFQVGILQASWETKISAIAICFLTPAITEELFFRALLLPHASENASLADTWLWGCISLMLFIVYHPLNALSFYPAGLKTFLNPVFLLLAAILGLVCSIVYMQSGSLWTAIVIHWLVVVVWLLLLGGYDKLNSLGEN